MLRAFVVMLMAALCVSAPSPVMAQDPVMDIVKQMKEVFEPVRPNVRTVDITMTSDGDSGGHHFDGSYEVVADTILREAGVSEQTKHPK